MLTYVDRMQLAVRDRDEAAATFAAVLGAERVRDDTLPRYAAERTVVQAGTGEFELLSPAGDGPVADHLARWGEGIFAAGFSTPDLGALTRRLSEYGIAWRDDGDQAFVEPDQTPGMRLVLSPEAERSPAGLVSWLYEATNIVDDHVAAADFYARTFDLDPTRFSPIASEQYGYTGQLLLFDPPDRLDRIELSQITDASRAMGRFHTKRGQSIYMCYVETPDVGAIVRRLEERQARWAGRSDDPDPEGIFIHPTALHGMLMGVSRTNLAWNWSGRPELAQAAR